jgi:hypothetical protein
LIQFSEVPPDSTFAHGQFPGNSSAVEKSQKALRYSDTAKHWPLGRFGYEDIPGKRASGAVEKVPASEKTRDRQGFAVAKRTQSRCFSSLLLICGTWKHSEKNKNEFFNSPRLSIFFTSKL